MNSNNVNPFFISSYVGIRNQKGGAVTPLGTAPMNDYPGGVISPTASIISSVSNVSPISIVSPYTVDNKSDSTEHELGTINDPTPTSTSSKVSTTSKKSVKSKILAERNYIYNSFLSPQLTVSNYPNVNNDADLQRSTAKYFYEKTFNEWLYGEFQDLLLYMKVNNGKVKIVNSFKEVDSNKIGSTKDIHKKVNYIAENIFSQYDMKSFTKKYAIKSGLDLWDLQKRQNIKYVKRSIYKRIRRRLEKYLR